jgi:hypothetical protein
MAARLDFAIARPLAEFILQHAAAGGSEALIAAQQSHYGLVRAEAPELTSWLDEIRRQVEAGKSAIRVTASAERRLQLWQDYPAAGDRSRRSSPQKLIPA